MSSLYFSFSLSISCSHCCFVLVILKVSGLIACSLGKGFYCCWFSIGSCWWEDQPLSSVLGIEGIQAPSHTFPLWDLVPPFYLLLLGRALPFIPFPLWPNSLLEATSSCPGTDCLTWCLHWAMECLVLPLWALMLVLHCWWVLVGFLVRVSMSL